MVAVIVIVLLVGLALAYVATPLRSPGPRREPADDDILEAEAGAKRDAALGALVDIQEEHQIGKLSAADFEVLRRQYEAEALAALEEIDSIRLSDPVDDALEAEIAAVRAELACPECGRARSPGESCPSCGA